jgi:hypothetical protein
MSHDRAFLRQIRSEACAQETIGLDKDRRVSAYYNEFDPFAAAWLRELIKAGLIAPGDVDEAWAGVHGDRLDDWQ